MSETGAMYRAINVWKKLNETTAVCYRCFENLTNGKFCVQSADFFNLPIDETVSNQLDRQFIELFLDEYPDVRSDAYTSLEEAIRVHDLEFEEEQDLNSTSS